ncbi:hypothetical protein [Candidatus Finniella inopinata]|uniref:Uncharacterized protein n=1 Tax=Candidatus Finniella inopinata TaxID=1696036 RepID=A0A4Q7DID7_9PROT|nr:hypothetical protein [Candidatus Finniella inopinata]RZI45865.1 hypothetical protein EQU50_05385 [Candidatus Finniella inopinata]
MIKLMKKNSFLMFGFLSLSLPLHAQTEFYKELAGLNQTYAQKIEETAQTPYDDLDGINLKRFGVVAGLERQVGNVGPTEDEWGAITESVWQHAACLLENDDVYRQERGFMKDGFKTQIHRLLQSLTGGKALEDLDVDYLENALALLSGLFYAFELFVPLPFDGWEVAGLKAYHRTKLFTSEFKSHLDDYFYKSYEKIKGDGAGAFSQKQQGHFSFFTPASGTAGFTIVARNYVTKDLKQQAKSPLYGARIKDKNVIQNQYKPGLDALDADLPQAFEIPLKPLMVGTYNVAKFPDSPYPLWLILKDFNRNDDCVKALGALASHSLLGFVSQKFLFTVQQRPGLESDGHPPFHTDVVMLDLEEHMMGLYHFFSDDLWESCYIQNIRPHVLVAKLTNCVAGVHMPWRSAFAGRWRP